MDKPIRCAVIGHAPMRLPWGFDEEDKFCSKMKMELAQQIMVLRQHGVSQFLTACDCGVGLYAGEIVNGLRMTDHDYLRERYFTMLEKCTLISAVCEAGTLDAQIRAYKKIIDVADMVLGVYALDSPAMSDAEDRALAYAVDTAHKPVLVLNPIKLTTLQINGNLPSQ